MERIAAARLDDRAEYAGIAAPVVDRRRLGFFAQHERPALQAAADIDLLHLPVPSLDAWPAVEVHAHLVGHVRDSDLIEALSAWLTEQGRPVVVFPQLFAPCGTQRLEVEALAMFKRRLALIADVLVVTRAELEELGGMPAEEDDDALLAAEMLLTLGPRAVVMIDAGVERLVAVHEEGVEAVHLAAELDALPVLAADIAARLSRHCTVAEAVDSAVAQLRG